MKNFLFLRWAIHALPILSFAATPTITNVTARQRYPWNGKVDITYTVTGDIEAAAEARGLYPPTISVRATDRLTGSNYVATALTGDAGISVGTHALIWDMIADGLTITSDDVIFDVSCKSIHSPSCIYCVIDLSAGANASSYPVTSLAEPPEGGFNTDEYKTTKLVLRCLEPGPVPTRDATITKWFYVGLFEVTQRQWELVMGTRPSYYSNIVYYATRPVEQVSYNDIRGSSLGSQWPASNVVDVDSFLGKLRARTSLDFDLPTEVQWEYACRAGTTTEYNSGKNPTSLNTQDSAMDEVGRYWSNGGGSYYGIDSSCTTAKGTAAVGSYLPNIWGLYDMHGNVSEWCLDWYGDSLSGNDPIGPSSGIIRVLRGGNSRYGAYGCTSSYRRLSEDEGFPSDSNVEYGFRLVRNLPD